VQPSRRGAHEMVHRLSDYFELKQFILKAGSAGHHLAHFILQKVMNVAIPSKPWNALSH
jgi:hypothetical protein